MPGFMDSLLRRGKRSIPSDVLKASHFIDIREGEQIIVTYTSVADKIKFFSSFIREGLEKGDAVWYTYPDEESATVRANLREHEIDVKKYEKDGALILKSLTEYYVSNGKLDYEKAIIDGLNLWTEMKRMGYKHMRDIEDVGDLSFADGQWQDYVSQYWLDPRWNDPDVSEWGKAKGPVGNVYVPFIMAMTAIDVEDLTDRQVTQLLTTMGQGKLVCADGHCTLIDLFEDIASFSGSIGLNHKRLIGRKFLLEFDPTSNYEKVVDSLAKENMANVEPIYIFTSNVSPIHTHLSHQLSIKFFLTSISTSTPQSTSENEVLLPAKNTPLILDALSKILETYADANVCFVFNILSDLLISIGFEKTFIFLRHALDLLSSKKVTGIFLLNSSAHEPEVVSRLKTFFSNQLAYGKNGLEVVKIS